MLDPPCPQRDVDDKPWAIRWYSWIMGAKTVGQQTKHSRYGIFPSFLGVFWGWATLVLQLALFPVAFIFGDDPQHWAFELTFYGMIGALAACFATLSFNFGRMQAKARKEAIPGRIT